MLYLQPKINLAERARINFDGKKREYNFNFDFLSPPEFQKLIFCATGE